MHNIILTRISILLHPFFTFLKLPLIGAVLFKDPEKARQIALLYQRYKKFDQTSYSISNVTFYNLFAAESVRVGRYDFVRYKSLVL